MRDLRVAGARDGSAPAARPPLALPGTRLASSVVMARDRDLLPSAATGDHLASEREELRARLADFLDPILTALAFVTIGALVVEVVAAPGSDWATRASTIQNVIWVVFLLDFTVQLTLAPRKLRFLRSNWLSALAVALPALRALRVLRAARALRGFNLLRILAGANRGLRSLGRVLAGRQAGFVIAATILVAVLGSAGIWLLERDQPGANIRSYADALWWASALVTTINADRTPVSPEGRIVAIIMRLYALGISGYITAVIASYLLSERLLPGPAAEPPPAPGHALVDEIAALRREVADLRAALVAPAHEPPADGAAAPVRRADGEA